MDNTVNEKSGEKIFQKDPSEVLATSASVEIYCMKRGLEVMPLFTTYIRVFLLQCRIQKRNQNIIDPDFGVEKPPI